MAVESPRRDHRCEGCGLHFSPRLVIISEIQPEHIINESPPSPLRLRAGRMRYRSCQRCGRHAMAIVKAGQVIKRLCLECLVSQTKRGAYRRYICSVAGCSSFPSYLVVVDEGNLASLLVCPEHYAAMRSGVVAVMPLPEWLAEADDITLTEEGITVELELFSRLDTESADGEGDGPRQGADGRGCTNA